MRSQNQSNIIAIVVREKNKEKVGGGAPLFYVNSQKELENTSMLLSRITMGMVHDLGNDIKVIIRH